MTIKYRTFESKIHRSGIRAVMEPGTVDPADLLAVKSPECSNNDIRLLFFRLIHHPPDYTRIVHTAVRIRKGCVFPCCHFHPGISGHANTFIFMNRFNIAVFLRISATHLRTGIRSAVVYQYNLKRGVILTNYALQTFIQKSSDFINRNND